MGLKGGLRWKGVTLGLAVAGLVGLGVGPFISHQLLNFLRLIMGTRILGL